MPKKDDSEAPAKDAQEEPSVPVGEEPAEAGPYDPADRVPGEVTTPMREMEMDARAKLREQGHDADPDQPQHRPYIDGDPAKYRRSGQSGDWPVNEEAASK